MIISSNHTSNTSTPSYHLSYCTNIHPGERWAEVLQSLKNNVPQIKKKVAPDQPFGLGLRLSNQASLELLAADQLKEFSAWLQQENVYVFTLNGFPYGGFHHQVVKDQVYQPDWTTQDRLDYTLRLFDILTHLLPDGIEGGISTSPLSYKPWHNSPAAVEESFEKATGHLLQVVVYLYQLHQKTGKLLHLDLEPEPDGLLENTAEVVAYFQNWLLPKGIPCLKQQLGLSEAEASEAICNHLQLCYDVCHFALAYEQPEDVFLQLQKQGIKIGKIQLSAALRTILPSEPQEREQLEKLYRPFAESTYLHQVVALQQDGRLRHYPDLPAALQDIRNPDLQEWRTHFHVPVFESSYGKLQSTQEDIRKVLAVLQEKAITRHLEVETYTWEVLPPHSRLPLQQSIIRELEWVKQVFSGRNSTEEIQPGVNQ